jgi:hypothetical protein
MRKRLITPIPQAGTLHDEGWLDLDRVAVVEVTSEEKEYPVEAALVAGEMRGWRAADSGAQTIRLVFDQPQRLKRIALVFEETETERTQEFIDTVHPQHTQACLRTDIERTTALFPVSHLYSGNRSKTKHTGSSLPWREHQRRGHGPEHVRSA